VSTGARRGCAAAALAALLVLGGAIAGRAQACELAHAPTTRWTVEHDGLGAAWLRTPCGARFFSLGVNVVDGGASGAHLNRPHYTWQESAPSLDAWAAETRRRLLGWGFNSAGAWSLAPQRLRLPTVINLELGRLAKFHWFDPFNPAMPARMRAEARRLTQPYRGSPYRIGYFSDNEVGWWGGALFVFYSAKPAQNFTKQRWVQALRRRYQDDWRRFTADFVPPPGVGDWRQLLATRRVTRLRPGGKGSAAVRAWTRLVAQRYYALAREALHAADPTALFFGDRLPIYYDPMAVEAEAPYVDAIATNYNVDSPEGWVAPYYFDGLEQLSRGKPVLVSEWFYAARQNRTGNRNNGHLMTVETQAERARGAAAAARNFAAFPEILGLHWFQYYDYPEGGRADREDYNFGLVDIRDRPYRRLVAALSAANRALPAIHEGAGPMARQSLGSFAVPEARIDPDQPTLIDWPKPQSLLPALQPEPGEVAFGEAYLAWNRRGLAFATIGQDYYDLDLLAYDGDFPLSEAYRLELDADAGAGPRHFTLYFIPPSTSASEHPMMTPLLCAGTAAEGAKNRCPAVPGAAARYFGADQPRIVGEALIPWKALGVAGPPANRRLRVEVSSSAWYHSRWMSLSGLSPVDGAARPERWAVLRLADR
jgi:hypothetical protein